MIAIITKGQPMARILILLVAIAGLSACSNKAEDLKSPCSGTDDSPCIRRPANVG
jgi:hypothetical protein